MNRRDFVRRATGAAAAALGLRGARAQQPAPARSPDVLVAGAGVMGLWTAVYLRRRGLAVTVVDPWEPGHPRGTSSSENRIIRAAYGNDGLYTAWSWKALDEWAAWEKELGRRILYRSGVLWFAREHDGYEAASEVELKRQGVPMERLSPAELRARFPQVRTDGILFALFEPQAGALLARESIRRLAEAFVRQGGQIRRGAARAGRMRGGRLADVECGSERISAECFVFACGPWLPKIFPDLVASTIRVTRQEELYFGVPTGDSRFDTERLPCWIEIGHYYGIPALEGRGFKVGNDQLGPEFDPSEGDRTVSRDAVEKARAFLAGRFPALARAPLVDSRVCTYESTADEHLLIDRHPGIENVWLLGGGSGHSFKLGPVLGDYVASHLAGEAEELPDPRFRLGERRSRLWRRT